jgi:hypothetical protein
VSARFIKAVESRINETYPRYYSPAGEPSKKGAFRGGQAVKILSPPPRSSTLVGYGHVSGSATDLFNSFAKDIILKGGYLNSDNLVDGLNNQIDNLHQFYMFKNIQNINRVVHGAVLCYWQSRSIRIFRELEAFVIKTVAGYKQEKSTPERFEAFGMGSLLRNDVVVKYFGLEDLPANFARDMLPDITSSEVLQCMQEFVVKNRNLGRPDEKMEEKFKDYLRRSYGTIWGVNVEFKSLFHATTQTRGAWFRELTDAKDAYAKRYREALKAALQRLADKPEYAAVRAQGSNALLAAEQTPMELIGDETVFRAASVDVRGTLTTLNTLGVNGSADFQDLARHLGTQKHANANSRFGLALQSIVMRTGASFEAVAQDFNRLFVSDEDDLSLVQLASLPAKKPRECIISCVVGLVAYFLATPPPHSGTDASADDSVGATDPVRSWFKEHLFSTVPDKCRNAVEALLKKLISGDQLFETTVSSSTGLPETAKVDWTSVRQRLEELLNGMTHYGSAVSHVLSAKKRGKRSGVASADPSGVMERVLDLPVYLGLVTAVILFRRVLDTVILSHPPLVSGKGDRLEPGASAEALASFIARRVNHQLTAADASAELVVTMERSGPLMAFFTALQSAEADVTTQLSVPAFECTRTGGSFLHLLVSQIERAVSSRAGAGEVTASNNNGTAVEGAGSELLEALRTLQEAVFPAKSVGDDRASEEDGNTYNDTEATDLSQNTTVEEALQYVSQQLGAVLTALEFAGDAENKDTPTDVFDWLFSLLLDAESRTSETLYSGEKDGALPSFLRLAQSVVASSGELSERLSRLLQGHFTVSAGRQVQDDSEDGHGTAHTIAPQVRQSSRVCLLQLALCGGLRTTTTPCFSKLIF